MYLELYLYLEFINTKRAEIVEYLDFFYKYLKNYQLMNVSLKMKIKKQKTIIG